MVEPDAVAFERSADRKVSFGLRRAGRSESAKFTGIVANTHGLPAGISCPCRTSVCAGPTSALSTSELERIAREGERAAGGRGRETTWRHLLPLHGLDPTFPCYVVADLRRGTEENAAYRNWALIRSHLDDRDRLEGHLLATLDEFLAECKDNDIEAVYRFHWDGDIPTLAMAEAIAAAVTARPTIRAWVYTRSLFAVPALDRAPNLITYISADADNAAQVAPLLRRYPRVRVAVLGRDPTDAAKVLTELDRRPAPVCPVDSGKLPVITATGAARPPTGDDVAVGACALCRLCVTGRSDVRFTLRKVLYTPKTVTPPTLLNNADGWAHHFGQRPEAGALFDGLLQRLRAQGAALELVWRRTYVTVYQDAVVVLRAQGRGRRLLLVWPHRPRGVRTHARLRDISKQRHQCPGVLEQTLTDPSEIDGAMRLYLRMPRPHAGMGGSGR